MSPFVFIAVSDLSAGGVAAYKYLDDAIAGHGNAVALSIRRNTSSYQNRSYAQITVRTDGHITGHVSGHVSIRIHCTSGFHVLAKSCLHCHVVYNRADGHSGALAATVRHRTGDHCRVHFGSGRYFQSIGQYQHHTISNQRLYGVLHDQNGKGTCAGKAAAHGRYRSAHCLQIIVLVREQI